MKKILTRIFILLLGIFIAIILCEGILRILNSRHIVAIDKKMSFANDPFLYSSTLKYRVKPYLVRDCTAKPNPKAVCYSNYLGLRDKDYSPSKPEGTQRIMSLGDSLTYGPGVNAKDTYPVILKNIIDKNNKSKEKHEVMNMGLIFYGPAQYYNLYEERGKKYDPDLIILSFHLLTDPYDSYEYDQNKKSYFLKSLPDIIPYKVSQPLKEKSFLFRAILSGYYGLINREQVDVEQKVFHGQKNRFQYDTQLTTTSAAMSKGWDLSEYYVDKLVKSAASNGSKIVIVIFPTPAQILPDEWKNMKEQGQKSSEKLYSDSAARKKMLSLCKKHGWTCLDLQDSLRKSDDKENLFLKKDIHLTGEGNKVAATAIYDFLKSKKLIY